MSRTRSDESPTFLTKVEDLEVRKDPQCQFPLYQPLPLELGTAIGAGGHAA